MHCLAGGIYTANSKSPFSLAAAPFSPPVLHKTRRTRLYFAIYFPPLLPLSLFFLLSSSESEHTKVYKRRVRALRTTTGHPPFSGLADHCFSKVCLSIRYIYYSLKNLFSLCIEFPLRLSQMSRYRNIYFTLTSFKYDVCLQVC